MKSFYKLLSSGIYPFLYPVVGYWMRKKRGYPFDFKERFAVTCHNRYDLLFHYASLGEARTLLPLLELWGKHVSRMVFQTVTPSGRDFLGDRGMEVLLFPLDYYPVMKRRLKVCGVRRVILFETELWPSILVAAEELGIEVMVINGKLSTSTKKLLTEGRFFWRDLLQGISHWYVVEKETADFLEGYGVRGDKIDLVPDIKYISSFRDVNVTDDEKISGLKRWIDGRKGLVMGSMHAGEEELLRHLRGMDIRIIYAPRHINRVDDLESYIRKLGFETCRFSGGEFPEKCEVVIVDVYGKLFEIYSVGDLAVIGGSFVPHGGHNPLEPLNFFVPVVFGPHMFNFKSIVKDVTESGAGKMIGGEELPSIVENVKELFPPEDLKRAVSDLKKKRQVVINSYRNLPIETF